MTNVDIRARVDELKSAITEQVIKATIKATVTERNARLAALDDRWHRLRRVIDQRAVAMADVAEGGDTGMLVRTFKQIGREKVAQVLVAHLLVMLLERLPGGALGERCGH